MTDEPMPVFHYEVQVNGKPLARNQECTLERGIGYPAGRYKFCYAEELDGRWALTFFGPCRRANRRWRQVFDVAGTVRTIHRAVAEEPPESE